MRGRFRTFFISAAVFALLPALLGAQNIVVNGDPLEYPVGIRGAVELEFLTTVGEYYQVVISPDLENWDNEGYSIKGTGGLVSTVVSTRQYEPAFYRVTDGADPANVAPWTANTGIFPIEVSESLAIGLNTTTATSGDLIKFDGQNWIFGRTDAVTIGNMQPFLTIAFIIAIQGVYPSRNGIDPYIGEISMFGGTFAPRGWAYCNGQLLSISSYSSLFSIIGTIYGGDGRTNFALPDLRGRVPIHHGQGIGLSDRRLGEVGGTESSDHAH